MDSDNTNSSADPFGEIADEFVEAFRRGENPCVEKFAGRYPEHAELIREMLPALVLMEKAKSGSPSAGGEPDPGLSVPLRQLGDYQILREVGRGGMGVVYEARQLSLGRHVALKVLPSHPLLDPRQLGRFQREARAAARLHHTNIVPVFGVGEEDGVHYYVMQFILGHGLDEVLTELLRLRRPGSHLPRTRTPADAGPAEPTRDLTAAHVANGLLSGSFRPEPVAVAFAVAVAEGESASATLADSSTTIHLPGQSEDSALTGSGRQYWQSVARIGIQVAEALSYASGQGVLHRDIKPSNLLLDEQGNVWVTDFGLAKADGDLDNLTHTGDIVGTLRYMAPERFAGEGDVRADIYGLGLTLYEMLTLRPAFDESDRNRLIRRVMHDEPVRPRKLNRAVPQDLETVVLKAIARDPAHRYQTPAELADDLKRFVDDRPIQARRVSEAEMLWRWCRRNPLPAGLMAAVMLVFLAGFVGVFWQWRNAEFARQEEGFQRTSAVAARRSAEAARDEALAEKERAEREESRARAAEERTAAALYGSNLVRAQLQFQGNNVVDAEEVLDDCEVNRRGWEWHFLKQLCHADLVTLHGHTSWVYAVAFRPDGKLIASGGGGNPFWETQPGNTRPGEVILWDATTGARRHILRGHENIITCVAFSPDGRTLATGSQDDTVRLWDPATGKSLGVLPARSPGMPSRGAGVSSIAFSPDGKSLAIGLFEKVAIWDLTRPDDAPLEPRSTLTGPVGHWSAGLAFRPDGKSLAVAHRRAWDGQVKVWDLAGEAEVSTFGAKPGMFNGVAWSPDGSDLAAWGQIQGICFWNGDTGDLLLTLGGYNSDTRGGAFSPSGESFAASGSDGVVRVWSIPDGREIRVYRGHRDALRCVAFNPSGQQLASGSEDGTVKVWDLSGDAEHGSIDATTARGVIDIESIAFADQGHRVVIAQRAGKVLSIDSDLPVLWGSQRTVDLTPRWLTPAEPACLDAQGKWLVGISRDDPRVAKCWDGASGQERARFRGHQQALSNVTISATGDRVATAGRQGQAEPLHSEVNVWDAVTGQPLLKLDEPNLLVTRIALSPDGDRLALAGLRARREEETRNVVIEPIVRVYHVGSADVWREFVGLGGGPGEYEAIQALTFSPDGTRLAAAGDGRTVLLWELSAEKPAVTDQGPEGAMDLTFSPDGRRLAVASRLQIRLLDAASGDLVLTLLGRKHRMPDKHGFNPRVRFSPDGRRIAAICHDTVYSIAIWSVEESEHQDTTARLRAAERRAIATHLTLALQSIGVPTKRAAFEFHMKQLEGCEFSTAGQYLFRGSLYAQEGRVEEAVADFDRATEMAPDDPWILEDIAVAFAVAGLWDRALPYVEQCFERGLGSYRLCCEFAALPLYLNDRPTARRYAKLLLERYGQSDNKEVLRDLLFWGLLFWDEGAPAEELVRLADRCLEGTESSPTNNWDITVKGMAEYRAGRFESAVGLLLKAEPAAAHQAGYQFFLSMGYHRLGKPDEAKAAYQDGMRHLTRFFGSPDRFTPMGGQWIYWPWTQLLRREVEQLLNTAPGPERPED